MRQWSDTKFSFILDNTTNAIEIVHRVRSFHVAMGTLVWMVASRVSFSGFLNHQHHHSAKTILAYYWKEEKRFEHSGQSNQSKTIVINVNNLLLVVNWIDNCIRFNGFIIYPSLSLMATKLWNIITCMDTIDTIFDGQGVIVILCIVGFSVQQAIFRLQFWLRHFDIDFRWFSALSAFDASLELIFWFGLRHCASLKCLRSWFIQDVLRIKNPDVSGGICVAIPYI